MEKNKEPLTISERLRQLESIINVDKFIDRYRIDDDDIKTYYKVTRKLFRRLQSKEGFMHFHVSKTGTYSPDDEVYQAEVAARYIVPGSKVLEMGSGQGANLLYLASKYPDSEFWGIDLIPAKLDKELPNLTIRQQSYQSMPEFPDNTFDVVYAVETIVHNEDKESIFREAHRVLNPGGKFIVFDWAQGRPYETYTSDEQKALDLIFKGNATAPIELEDAWTDHFAKAGFTVVSAADRTKEILPDLKRLEQKADSIMTNPLWVKMCFHTMPKLLVSNLFVGYLGYETAKNDVWRYKEWIYQKL